MRGVFNTVKENQKQCVIIQHEIYVKKSCYTMWGLYLVQRLMILHPLRKIVLAVMIPFMLGGPTSISTSLPIKKSNSPFLHKQRRLTIDAINQTTGEVKVVICDGNRKITKPF